MKEPERHTEDGERNKIREQKTGKCACVTNNQAVFNLYHKCWVIMLGGDDGAEL